MPNNKSLPLAGMNLWWVEPDAIHLGIDNHVFYGLDEDGERFAPGLYITFSSNIKSANYHPQYFNRCVRALRDAGVDAPPLCEEQDRRIDRRGLTILPKELNISGKLYKQI